MAGHLGRADARRPSAAASLSPDEALTREQAIRLYTINNAYLHHEEKEKGSLEVGKLGDLIVIDRDVLTCPVDDVRRRKVLLDRRRRQGGVRGASRSYSCQREYLALAQHHEVAAVAPPRPAEEALVRRRSPRHAVAAGTATRTSARTRRRSGTSAAAAARGRSRRSCRASCRPRAGRPTGPNRNSVPAISDAPAKSPAVAADGDQAAPHRAGRPRCPPCRRSRMTPPRMPDRLPR